MSDRSPRPKAGIANAQAIAQMRLRFRAGKADLFKEFESGRPSSQSARKLLHGLSRHADATLASLWRAMGMPSDASLLAVGGDRKSVV